MKETNPRELWNAFAHTGRIEDYLRYRGIDIYTARVGRASAGAPPQEEADPGVADHRSPDHPGKQQYR